MRRNGNCKMKVDIEDLSDNRKWKTHRNLLALISHYLTINWQGRFWSLAQAFCCEMQVRGPNRFKNEKRRCWYKFCDD